MVLLLALLATLTFASGAMAAQPQVNLSTADSYAALAAATITNTGPTTITGDLGLHAGTSVTGAPTVIGNTHVADAAAQQAQVDLGQAYIDAVGRGPTTPSGADIGGKNLLPGVYNSASSIGITGTVTLDGGGDANAVFIFQAGSTLITEVNSRVVLVNGTQACNVFWAVGSACAVAGGVSWPYYAVSVGVSGFVLAIVLLTILVGGPILILIKVAVMVAYLPTLWRWIKRNRPARGTLTALPPGTVPPLIA